MLFFRRDKAKPTANTWLEEQELYRDGEHRKNQDTLKHWNGKWRECMNAFERDARQSPDVVKREHSLLMLRVFSRPFAEWECLEPLGWRFQWPDKAVELEYQVWDISHHDQYYVPDDFTTEELMPAELDRWMSYSGCRRFSAELKIDGAAIESKILTGCDKRDGILYCQRQCLAGGQRVFEAYLGRRLAAMEEQHQISEAQKAASNEYFARQRKEQEIADASKASAIRKIRNSL